MLPVIAHAWQSWKNAKTVFLMAAIAFAVGIGSTTAIYTVVNAVMLKPLTYQHGERYGALFSASVGQPDARGSLRLADLLEYQQATQSFDVFGWFKPQAFTLTSPGQPQHVEGALVTTTLARSLGVEPRIGRWFEDDSSAVISAALWTRLGSDPNILGTSIVLNGRPYVITGVMPPRFRLPEVGHTGANVRNDVWIGLDPGGRGQDPEDGSLFSYARLKPGVTFAQADADVKRVAQEIARRSPADHPGYTAAFDSLRWLVVKEVRPTMLLLLGAAGLLLLITAANVSALLLSRSVERARDTAIRVALGVGQRQLAFQYFVEGLFVSVAGAVAGVFLSVALVRVVLSMAADFIPRVDEIAIDWRVLLFVLGTAGVASALSGLAPLWLAVRTSPNAVLTDGVRASAGARTRKLSTSLVIAEIALAFTLLAVSAVLMAHLGNLMRISPGFDTNGLLTFKLTLPSGLVSKPEQLVPHQIRLIDALEGIPGVSRAAFTNQTPLDGCCLTAPLYPEGRPADLGAAQRTAFLPISPGFFETMGMPLRSGRLLTYRDANSDVALAVINEAAVRFYWPDRPAEGAFGKLGSPDGDDRFQVIGIVADIQNDGLGKPPVPELYILHTVAMVDPMAVVVRSKLPVGTLLPEIRRAIARLDPAQPIYGVATFPEIAHRSVALQRLASFMTAFFAFAALLMATLGIYGIVSYSVRQRTVEIGTRMALGAHSRDLLTLIVGSGVKMAVLGMAAGGIAVAAAVWLLTRQFDIRGLGWIPFASSTAIVAAVAGAASFFPAWRATRMSPLVAIRNEPGALWRSAGHRLRHAMRSISRVVSGGNESAIALDGMMLAEFGEAARSASSSKEALHTVLTTLCRIVGAEWAMLVEENSGPHYRTVASTSPQSALEPLAAHGLLLNRLRFHSFPLPFTGDDLEAWLRWAGVHGSSAAAEIESLQKNGARIAVPLRTKDEIVGVLLLGPPLGGDAYGPAETHALKIAAGHLALMLENARLTDRIVEQEKLRRDLALAAEVQKRLLPDRPPDARLATLAAVSLPARIVGGDYYDFLDVGEHRIGIALADVAGKGVAAALIMSVVHASLRIISSDGDVSLPQLAARMNRFLHRSTQSNGYATFFYAQLDQERRQLHYVNAGHNPPYLVRRITNTDRSESEIQELSTGGTVIGLFPHMDYEQGTVDLQSGDVLIMFTDGVTEALNPVDEEFGEQRLQVLVREVAHLPVQEISSRLTTELRQWISSAAQHDDLTFVVMKVN